MELQTCVDSIMASRVGLVSPGQIHVWCYASVLNLVVTDATSSVIEGYSL